MVFGATCKITKILICQAFFVRFFKMLENVRNYQKMLVGNEKCEKKLYWAEIR